MKSWYCIYECSEGKWLMDNQWWSSDLGLHTEYLPTMWEGEIQTNINPIDGERSTHVRMMGNSFKDIAVVDTNHKTNPYSILRFETLQQAEIHLLDRGFDCTNGKYYTIRKIYF